MQEKEDFVLLEDRDSGHGPAENNKRVRRFRERHHVKFIFNSAKSPELSARENAFQPLKQFISNTGHWLSKTLKRRAKFGLENCVTYHHNDKQVKEMSDRMWEVLDRDG